MQVEQDSAQASNFRLDVPLHISGAVREESKPQISPLRYASVEMTNLLDSAK
jgi:hypothetical protein